MTTRQVQIAVIGGCSVGKTALVVQLISALFEEEYVPTADEDRVAMLDYGETSIKLVIHDTSGSEKFAEAREEKYTTAEGFLAVYSIERRRSFNELRMFLEKLQQVRGIRSIPLVVVGNKVDLQNVREVERSEGEELAKTLGCPFVELTARERDSVVGAFKQLIREMDKTAVVRKENMKLKLTHCTLCALL
ncbi:unnamed protein product [Candidula unifasciata]|uniref:small monomeric GTPase n=1 Tax=Candidula unifasciata TaxID=100452 RepID=A0A8S3YPG7_9EUPU|nr:unnamed protein product [Candidula unifasciata]